MIQNTLGDNALSAMQIKAWHKHVKDGGECVESDPRSGRPAPSRTPGNGERVRLQSTKIMTDSVRTRSGSGGSKKCCVQDFDTGSWHEMCRGKMCLVAFATRAEGTSGYVANNLIQTATNEPDVFKKVMTQRGLRCY